MEVKQPNNGHLAGAQLFKYAMEGENDNVREMMTTGGLLASDTVGTTALHCAVIGNQLETCELFLQAGVSVDVKTKVDRTPLHFAVFHGHERMVKLLLSKSCEVDPVDMLQMTPLHWAVEKNHVNIARLLLESGASPYSVSKFGKTPKGMAEERDNPSLRRLFSKYDWSETKPKQDEDPRDMVDYALQEDAGSDIENISVFEEDLDEVEVIPAPEMETEEIESANGDVEDVAAAGRLVAHDSDDSFTNLQEAIEKLGDVKEIKPSDPTTLKILQKIGLQITDEHDPSMLMNVLQSGRRIVLSEAGKYILNKTKNNERLDLPDAGSKKQNVPTVPNSTQPPVNKRIRTRESLRADPSSLVKRSRISESERMGTRNKSAADLRVMMLGSINC